MIAAESRLRQSPVIPHSPTPLQDDSRQELTTIWNGVREELRDTLPQSAFENWLEPLRAVGIQGTRLYVSGPDRVRDWFQRRYGAAATDALRRRAPGFTEIAFTDPPADGTSGSRGAFLVTDASCVVARLAAVWEADCDPDHQRDVRRQSNRVEARPTKIGQGLTGEIRPAHACARAISKLRPDASEHPYDVRRSHRVAVDAHLGLPAILRGVVWQNDHCGSRGGVRGMLHHQVRLHDEGELNHT